MQSRDIFLLRALKAYGTWSFFAHYIMTLQTGNFKHAQLQMGATTEECNTPLKRPLLGLSNELLLDFKECSVLPLGGAKHSTLLF